MLKSIESCVYLTFPVFWYHWRRILFEKPTANKRCPCAQIHRSTSYGDIFEIGKHVAKDLKMFPWEHIDGQ